MASRANASEFVRLVVDEGSFRPLPGMRTETDDPAYAAELEAAREKTGLDESVLTGTTTLDGRKVVLVAGEFGFLGGSIGHVASDLVLQAFVDDRGDDHAIEVHLVYVP